MDRPLSFFIPSSLSLARNGVTAGLQIRSQPYCAILQKSSSSITRPSPGLSPKDVHWKNIYLSSGISLYASNDRGTTIFISSAIFSAFSLVLFRRYIFSAPALSSITHTALAAPPAPIITTFLPLSSTPLVSRARRKPGISVLYPLQPFLFFERTKVFTAPIFFARSSISTSDPITSCLYGTVTLRPFTPEA